jgi:uracil-DNA glycosylase
MPTPRPRFGHGAEATVGRYSLVGAFHPSQQNTFTGKLTPEMLDVVVRRATALAG